jgi:hypothetical protein
LKEDDFSVHEKAGQYNDKVRAENEKNDQDKEKDKKVWHKIFVEEFCLPGLHSINRISTRCPKAHPSRFNIAHFSATNSVRGSSLAGDTSFINLVHAISSHV